jgi:hypothetical protein
MGIPLASRAIAVREMAMVFACLSGCPIEQAKALCFDPKNKAKLARASTSPIKSIHNGSSFGCVVYWPNAKS